MTGPSPKDAPPAEAGAGIWSPGYRLLTAGLVTTIVAFAFEAMAVGTALPVTVRELGGLELYGWAFSAMLLATLFGTVAGGILADARGLTRPFVAGVVLFIAGLVVAGVAPSMPVVVAGRFVQGLGAGGLAAATYTAIGRGYPASAKPRMLAAISSGWVLPSLIGPVIAGALADHLSWRLIFLGMVPIMAAALLALPALARLDRRGAADRRSAADRTPPGRPAWGRVRLALGLTAGAGLLLGGLGGASQPLRAVPLLAVGLALMVVTLPRLLPGGTLTARPGTPAAIATVGLICFAFFGAEAFVPLALVTAHGISTTQAGLTIGVASLSWTAGSWVQARRTADGSRRSLILTGAVLVAVAVAGTVFATLAASPTWATAVTWVVGGFGMGLAFSTCSLVVLEAMPPGREGGTASAVQLCQTLGSAIGTGAGGALIAVALAAGWPATSGIRLGVGVCLVAGVLAALAAARTPSRRLERAPQAV